MSCSLYLRKMDGEWVICASSLESEFRFLIDWLELALGGRGFTTPFPLLSSCIRLEDDNNSFLNPPEAHGCWRKKILAGNILGPIPPTPMKPSASGDSSKAQPFAHPFPQSKDGLILSAAALWSLFDNALERVSNCTCTFKSAGGDFIQCKEKSGSWFLWHTLSKKLQCDGTLCAANISVALNSKEPGEWIKLTSPCVLGWAAEARARPDSALWQTLKASADFRKSKFEKYEIQSFQA